MQIAKKSIDLSLRKKILGASMEPPSVVPYRATSPVTEISLRCTRVDRRNPKHVRPIQINPELIESTLAAISTRLKFECLKSPINNFYVPFTPNSSVEKPKEVFQTKSPVLLFPCNHRYRLPKDLFKFSTVPCPSYSCDQTARKYICDKTLCDSGEEFLAVLSKLKGRANEKTQANKVYDVSPAYATALRNRNAYMLNCGHSVDKYVLCRSLKIPALHRDQNVEISNNVHCNICKKKITHAQPNLPLQEISQQFINFVDSLNINDRPPPVIQEQRSPSPPTSRGLFTADRDPNDCHVS